MKISLRRMAGVFQRRLHLAQEIHALEQDNLVSWDGNIHVQLHSSETPASMIWLVAVFMGINC